MKSYAYLILLSGFLISCSGLPVTPAKYLPLTTGIIPEGREHSSLNTITGGADKNLAIILSQNSKNSINYLISVKKDSLARAEKYSASKDSFLYSAEVNDPEFFTKYIMKSLKRKFERVTLLQNISEFKQENYAGLAIVDIYRKNDSNVFQTIITSNVLTAFYDVDLKYVNTVGSSINQTITHSTNNNSSELDTQIYKINLTSLQNWEGELIKVIAMPTQKTPKFK